SRDDAARPSFPDDGYLQTVPDPGPLRIHIRHGQTPRQRVPVRSRCHMADTMVGPPEGLTAERVGVDRVNLERHQRTARRHGFSLPANGFPADERALIVRNESIETAHFRSLCPGEFTAPDPEALFHAQA